MTSESFVYITLPGQTEPVTAGKFVLTKNRQGISLGKFIYGKSYLVRPDAVAFDPVELKLTDKIYETVALKGVFRALPCYLREGGYPESFKTRPPPTRE